MELRRIGAGDPVAGFSSGDDDLDRYLRRFAWFNQCRGFSVTYVAMEDGIVAAYVTVAVAHIKRDDLPEQLTEEMPGYPLPALRVARLAVDAEHQGRGLGALLLRAMIARAREIQDIAGCVGLLIDALQDATGFYEQLGFVPLTALEGRQRTRPRPVPMFLEMGAAELPPGDDAD